MKIIQILSHPLMQVTSFCIILISGESFGGPYIMYLYNAVKEGILYAIIGIAGIVLTLVSLAVYRNWLQPAGILFMVLSLLLFFLQPEGSYNYGTFHAVVPLLTLLLFICVMVLVTQKTLKI